MSLQRQQTELKFHRSGVHAEAVVGDKVGILEGLKIGRSAPSWLLAMLATQKLVASKVV